MQVWKLTKIKIKEGLTSGVSVGTSCEGYLYELNKSRKLKQVKRLMKPKLGNDYLIEGITNYLKCSTVVSFKEIENGFELETLTSIYTLVKV